MIKYELTPIYQKSFYGKAIIEIDNNIETLYSYGTKIISKDSNGNLKRFWNGWTQTTGKHIKAFCGLNKKEFLNIPLDETN